MNSSVSRSILVIDPFVSMNQEAVLSIYDAVLEQEPSKLLGLKKNSALQQLWGDLEQEFGNLAEATDETIDSVPWSCEELLTSQVLWLEIGYKQFEEVSKSILKLCRRYRLTLFDGSRGLTYFPPHLTKQSSLLLESPLLIEDVHATRELIRDTLKMVPGSTEPYVIVSESREHFYMQTIWEPEGYILEYREGSESTHYRATTYLSLADTQAILTAYAFGQSHWREATEYVAVVV